MNKNFVEYVSKYRTYLMGVSIIMIMFFHNQWVRDVNWLKPINQYGYFGVDIFLFISGFGIFHSLQKNTITVYFKNRLFRIVPLCLICGLLKFLIGHFLLNDDGSWSWQSLIGFELWYIKAIWVLYCFSPLFYKYLNRFGHLMLTLSLFVAILSLQLCSNETLLLFLPRIPVYLLGMMTANNMIKASSKILFISFIFFLLAVFHRLAIINEWFVLGNAYYSVLFLSGGIFFLMWGLIQLSRVFSILHLDSFIFFSGKHSLELYLVHQFIYYSFIHKFFFQIPSGLIFITAILFSYAISYLVYILNLLVVDLHKINNRQ